MAPKNDIVAENNTVADPFTELFHQLNKEFEASKINYPTEDKYEENEDNVIISLKLGDFKPEDVKVTLDDLQLVIEGQSNDHSFFRSCNLPYPCHNDKIETLFKDDIFTITVHKDEDKHNLMLQHWQEEEQKAKEALDKFDAMKPLKPITLEECSEEEDKYLVQINLGDYLQNEVNAYFNGPHYLVIEGVKDGEVKRRYFRHLYFDAPCKSDGEVQIETTKEGFLNITVLKDVETIKAVEDFHNQMRPIQDWCSTEPQESEDGFSLTLNISSFAPDEVKVDFDEDGNMIIEAKHESGDKSEPCFSLYRRFPLPEGVTKENVTQAIENGQLKIKALKVKPALRQG